MKTIASSTNNASNKPLVGISGCLTGQKVRYDGQSKLTHFYDALSTHLSWLTFCPEVEAGLGAPRPPVQLVETKQGTKALGVKDNSIDVTEQLSKVSQNFWSQHSTPPSMTTEHSQNFMCGYIFKSRSPSCGMESTPLYDNSGTAKELLTSGLFARHALDQPQPLVLAEETLLTSPQNQAIFISACYVNHAFHSGAKLDAVLLNLLMDAAGIHDSQLGETKTLQRLLSVLFDSYSHHEDADLICAHNKKTALDRRFLCSQLTSLWNL